MDVLLTMFRHHAWATLRLIDHCTRLSPEQLQMTVPGTYGSIRATLTHLVAADERYLRRMANDVPEPAGGSEDGAMLPELRRRFEAQAQRWQEFLGRADELDVTMPPRGPYPEMQGAAPLLFLQAIHHGNDHRTQVCTILGAHGMDVPDLDGWAYWPNRDGA